MKTYGIKKPEVLVTIFFLVATIPNQSLLPQDKSRFELREIKGDKVVIDNVRKLMWQQSGSPRKLQFDSRMTEDVSDYIKDLNENKFAGNGDWRLPTLIELKSLITEEKQKNGLYIDPLFDDKQFHIWTSDIVRDQSSTRPCEISVWKVYFDKGTYSRICDSYYGMVRAVRYF